jgi:hypothetical protein
MCMFLGRRVFVSPKEQQGKKIFLWSGRIKLVKNNYFLLRKKKKPKID